ncbi:uncharacterized protein LOC119727181 isoform X2 [Patiria miniata]|uniref:Uncharacterized protein n=1 Tax=Patiria miniata TaxID=46514 RepID=A0A913ZT88_PATMI|nr:uncharacterized protein LOC119727181 isoform X2 [Patiria miniata]
MASGAPGNNIAVSRREARPLRDNDDAADLDRRFQQALALTEGVPISRMHRQDLDLLNRMLHERPQLLQTSSRFHYLKFADIVDVPRLEARSIETAEGVLEYLIATKEVEPTVADVLRKLRDSQQCYHVVRNLVNNIIQRGQNGV